ncbi:extracellular solute-binding protein [Paenibacillus puerhi]|uniref:extracellular solute-binding protein n=1 Tax=Paenibacillus puerhi TaxID=2692622 RepID=UPI001356F634|nr:extracellular solute-binding protein [Paenibacillus puerhi]
MKKQTATLLTVTLLASMAAACSTPEPAPAPAAPGGGDAPQKAEQPKEKKTFTALLDNNATFPYSKDWPVWNMIEEKTGVRLNVQLPSGKLADTLSLVVASGNMPDLIYMANRKNDSNKYGQQGALVNILDHVKDMPNLKKWIEKYPDEAKAATASDGKMYMFPNQGFGETNRMIWLHREDIFKKHNLTAPTTYDELYTVLKKLKEQYPDSYPFAFRFGQIPDEMMAHLTTNFQTGEDVYYDFDKKEWRYGATEDNYKQMVTMMNKFVKEGLMQPDFLTVQTKQWQDAISTGKSFVTIDYISRVDFFNNAMRKEQPEYNMQFMAPPAGLPGGKQLNPYMHFLEGGLTVASTSKNVKDIMSYMDFFYSEEGRTLASWGKEGETYTKEGDKKKFKPEFTDLTEMRKKTGLATSGTYTWFDYDAHLSLFTPDLQKAYTEARKYDPVAMQPRPAFTEKEMEVLSVTGQAVKKFREESFAKFVTGSRPLSDWDKYVQEMNNLGVQKLVDTYKEAYKRVSDAK